MPCARLHSLTCRSTTLAQRDQSGGGRLSLILAPWWPPGLAKLCETCIQLPAGKGKLRCSGVQCGVLRKDSDRKPTLAGTLNQNLTEQLAFGLVHSHMNSQ